MIKIPVLAMVFALAAGCSSADINFGSGANNADKVALPKPKEKSDVDLLKALRGRHSTREFDTEKAIPNEVLATILWAADGVNREDGKRTAPCAMGVQHKRIYICKSNGAWRYDQKAHALVPVKDEDIRGKLGRQKFMASAPAVLILVSDMAAFKEKMPKAETARLREWSQAATGCMAQNVYLTAEAFGLCTVMAAGLNADEVKKLLSLNENEVPLFLMPLGYPKAK